MNFSIAGRDTTAQTLSWYLLTTTLTYTLFELLMVVF